MLILFLKILLLNLRRMELTPQKKKGSCFICEKVGHFGATCRMKNIQQQRQGGGG